MNVKLKLIGIGVALSFMAVPFLARAETLTFKASSMFPTETDYTQQFLRFVKKVNNDKKLNLKINFIGGPEAVPRKQQGKALKNGIIDMSYGTASAFYSQVPEGWAIEGSKIGPAKARKNGGIKLLDSAYKKEMNAHFLGWFGSDNGFFHIYTTKKPHFNSAGKIKGTIRIRAVPLYRALLEDMGFTPVTIQIPDVYTGLQRGAVQGAAWPIVGVTDLGWQHFLKYRINPGFYHSSIIVLVNLDSLNKLSDKQQKELQNVAIAFEKTSKNKFNQITVNTEKKLEQTGVKTYKLHGTALKRYKKIATELPWKEMKHYGGHNVEVFRKHFAPGEE